MRRFIRHLKALSLNFSGFGIALAAYTAPVSYRGRFTYWKGQHSDYKSGYVVRLLWLGFVIRWNKLTQADKMARYINSPLHKAIEQANDGDYPDPVWEQYLSGSPGLKGSD